MCLVEFFFNGSKIPELQKFAIKVLSDKVSVVSACERERERERGIGVCLIFIHNKQ